MNRDIIHHNESVRLTDRTLDLLHSDFPQCFNNEGRFDMAAFRELLCDNVDFVKEGSGFNFLGKNYASLLASMDTTTVLVPDTEHNRKPENANSQNIYISGDNLDALKHLVKSYAGKVKCIYIDPPYNTGKDGFIYNDKFRFTAEDLQDKLGVSEEQAGRILAMTSRGAASHSAWLTFMMPRLMYAKDLLSDDGVIFISIDDNEQANLKLLCNYVFGEENCIGQIIWKNATDNNPTRIACEHEYIISYARNIEFVDVEWKSGNSTIKDLLVEKGNELVNDFNGERLQEEWKKWYKENKEQLSPLDRYKYIDEGGIYTGSQSVHNPGKEGYRYDVIHPITGKPCKQPLMGYRFPQETMKRLIKEGRILYGEDENKIIELKLYASEYEEKLSSVYFLDGRTAAYDLKDLFPETKQIFKNPKPVSLIEYLLSFINLDNEIFVDFFSGSATSAQAVLDLNKHAHIKYILVQLDEPIKPNSEAYEFGFCTIDQLGQERIRRAAAKIKAETNADIDYGFKHFTLAEPDDNTLDRMERFVPTDAFGENLLDAFGKDTVLATYAVRDGYGLTPTIEPVRLGGYTAYLCGKHLYMIEPEFNIYGDDLTELVDMYNKDNSFAADTVVLFGYSFSFSQTDSIKKNLGAIAGRSRINIDIRY